MIRGAKIAVCVLGGIALTAGTEALSGEATPGPYHGIVERNVFNLKPPPPAVPPEPPAAPPPKITLTGITTILGNKRALLRVPIPAKPPEPAKDESYILTEDERRGGIYVMQINEKEGTVKVDNHGQIQILDFKNDGAKQVAVAPPAPAPVPQPMVPPPMPVTPPPPGAAGRTIPTRTMRLPTAPGANSSVPAPGVQGYGGPQATVNPQGGPQPLPAEAQMILIEAQRMRYQQEGNPAATILPPTPLTPQ